MLELRLVAVARWLDKLDTAIGRQAHCLRRTSRDFLSTWRHPVNGQERHRADSQLVAQVRAGLVVLQVQLCNVVHRWPRLQQANAVGVGNRKRDLFDSGCALIEQLELTVLFLAVNFVGPRGQHPHLLNDLFPVITFGLSKGFKQPQLGQLLAAVDDLTAPTEDVARGISDEVGPSTAVSCSIHQNTDVAVTQADPSGFIQKLRDVVALQICVKQLLCDRVTDIGQSDRLAGQHARQHFFNASVEG